ncbi:bifunctional DNA-formamidopyrimidine glycosylase/DNA-(apurinic or apyrimidinic site) lyase [Sinimarinibacterium sp. CAU 1509]|uniref:bifunctional DNA-formamidopyrimidine glycosylase/DNA-(apurinic or apyrimidinic site) lyase n=1 Tax=Sinimarinibacterium sp. CAU 1509 TaxID=2562283 RepID=UPI0010AC77BE|nr:bifunctional DNA-formamidopyrimidine glycosylase/DNA-(apurinic or apyrimidinic site) lyase [Sinimarinibacterium sp. CAU 1509]TJY58242.1 bifunctional DNA-formamidopyrimidine glycosylase/DNA-(apurinic or apyrimidinic site) lyase [Sinimarinibacterium sp. CAU 1509]
MPELPEVETVRRGLEPYWLHRRITQVKVREPRMRWPVPPELPALARGRRVDQLERRGKYLIVTLDSGDRLILHLGMSGRLFVLDPSTPLKKHDHIDFELDNGKLIRFNDPRRFGALLLWPAGEPEHPLLAQMGPEPFSEAFDGEYLYALSRGRSAAVKNFIMDGHVVVGAGNIYAAESLFRAGIRPTRPAGRVTQPQYVRLAQTIRDVLAEAIQQGGTTLRDFAGADGGSGYFQQQLFVYGRSGEPCRVCATPIKCMVIGQRSSFYCPQCQR